MNHVYIFYWCECIHETGYTAVSIHKTMKGAYGAMRKYILKDYEDFLNFRENVDSRSRKFFYTKNDMKDWRCRKVQVLD